MNNEQHKNEYVDHIWSVIAASSAIDRDTNSLSLFNVVEEVTIERNQNDAPFPAEGIVVPIQFELLTLWRKKVPDAHIVADVEVEERDPSGASLQKMIYKLEIAPPHGRLRFRMKMNGFKVTTAGDYAFVLRIREPNTTTFRDAAVVPLEVKMK